MVRTGDPLPGHLPYPGRRGGVPPGGSARARLRERGTGPFEVLAGRRGLRGHSRTGRHRYERMSRSCSRTVPDTGSRPSASSSGRRSTSTTKRCGGAPVLTAPRDPSKCPSSGRVTASGTRAEVLAGLDPKPGHSWHSLMRQFASDLMNQLFWVLSELGGWKTARTVLQCCQRADEDQLHNALANRRRMRA